MHRRLKIAAIHAGITITEAATRLIEAALADRNALRGGR